MKIYTITFILTIIVFIYDQVLDTKNFIEGVKQMSQNNATGFLLANGYTTANVIRTLLWMSLLATTIILIDRENKQNKGIKEPVIV